MTVDEAIDISWGADKFRNIPRPNLQETLERITFQLSTCNFNWLTGQEAKRVLEEAISQPVRIIGRGFSPDEACDLIQDHDVTVTELTKAMNSPGGRGTKGRIAAVRKSTKALFTALVGRKPTPEEIELCMDF